MRARLAAAIETGTLAEVERGVVELRAASGGTPKEIADGLGMSLTRLYTKLRKYGLEDMPRRREEPHP